MSTTELESKVRELRQLQSLIEEARHLLQAGQQGPQSRRP